MANIKASPYKNYARKRRFQLPDKVFNLGMIYTNSPLPLGAVKILANYDIKNNGELVRPRRAIRASSLALCPKEITSGSVPVPYHEDMTLTGGQICVELDNRAYRQVIVGQPTATLISGTTLYKGYSYAATVYPQGESYENTNLVPDDLEEGLTSVELHTESIGTDIVNGFCTFTKPDKAEAHGFEITNLNYIARQVGTFAFNNSYYCFKLKDDGTSKLTYTKLQDRGGGYYAYKPVEITPRALTPKEAVLWGYNMLAPNPYTFANTETVGAMQLEGMLPYDADNNLLMSPQLNQNIVLKANYAVALTRKYTLVWEWKEPTADTWNKLKEEVRTFTDLSELKADFSPPVQNVMVRLSAYYWSNGTSADTVAEKVLIVGFNFSKEMYGSTANVEAKTYDLSRAKGMSYWKNRLVLWLDNLLFLSEVNDPSYIPYPNNAELFDEPVVYGVPLKDDFLVFTTTKLHILTLNSDGLTWTKKEIQGNLNIQEWDIHLTRVVKNMVFFKSGNYFYMVVPSKTQAGNLVIAPISKNIEPLLDNFRTSVSEILDAVYDYRDSVQLVHYYNFLDYEDVHNVYVFKTSKDVYINLVLLYDIVNRTWRIHLVESQHILVPFAQDAAKKGILMGLLYTQQTWKVGAGYNSAVLPAIQFLEFTNTNTKDFYVPTNIIVNPYDTSDVPSTVFETVNQFKNYQLFDSGYREQDSDYKKRYREIQFKINNVSQETLKFFTEFLIDGELRRSMYRYQMEQIVDPENPDYGLIYLRRELIDPTIAPGTTILGETEEDVNCWALDVSLFPEAVLWKIRIPVSGKGYAPRMRIISYNEQEYELLDLAWIFRILNSR